MNHNHNNNHHAKIEYILTLVYNRLSNIDVNLPFDVKKALQYLHDHLFDPQCSIKRMKEECHIQTNNFSTRFSGHVGLSPKQYLIYHRMDAAKKLLSEDELKHLSISRIGFAVGYEKSSSFSTVFKNKVGVTPGAWRRKTLKNRRKN